MSILLINAQPMTGNISETVEKPKGKTKAFFEFEWTAGDAEDPRARSPSEAVTQATTGSRYRLRAAILTVPVPDHVRQRLRGRSRQSECAVHADGG